MSDEGKYPIQALKAMRSICAEADAIVDRCERF
jgi:pyruvate kinase